MEAVSRNLLSSFEDYVKLSNKISPETLLSVNNLDDPERLADIIAANVLVRTEDKQRCWRLFIRLKGWKPCMIL